MSEKLPLIRLQRFTWIQTVIIGFISYLVASNTGKPFPISIYTFLTMSGILLVDYLNISMMFLLSLRYSIRSKRFALLRRIFTYIASILIYLLLMPAFEYADHIYWSFFEPGSFFAFVRSGVVIATLIALLHDSVLLYEYKLLSDLELSRLKAANAEVMHLDTETTILNLTNGLANLTERCRLLSGDEVRIKKNHQKFCSQHQIIEE